MATENRKSLASMKYARENKKRIPLDVQKEYYEKELLPHVVAQGIPLNTWIKQAIAEKMEKEKSGK